MVGHLPCKHEHLRPGFFLQNPCQKGKDRQKKGGRKKKKKREKMEIVVSFCKPGIGGEVESGVGDGQLLRNMAS